MASATLRSRSGLSLAKTGLQDTLGLAWGFARSLACNWIRQPPRLKLCLDLGHSLGLDLELGLRLGLGLGLGPGLALGLGLGLALGVDSALGLSLGLLRPRRQ